MSDFNYEKTPSLAWKAHALNVEKLLEVKPVDSVNTWRATGGKVYHINDMDTQHLLNVIGLLSGHLVAMEQHDIKHMPKAVKLVKLKLKAMLAELASRGY